MLPEPASCGRGSCSAASGRTRAASVRARRGRSRSATDVRGSPTTSAAGPSAARACRNSTHGPRYKDRARQSTRLGGHAPVHERGSYQRPCVRRRAAARRYHYDPGVSDQALAVDQHIPEALRPGVEQKVALAGHEQVARRLREADATLWGPTGTPEVANRLGWLTIAERMLV